MQRTWINLNIILLIVSGSTHAQVGGQDELRENIGKQPDPIKTLIFRGLDIPGNKKAAWQYLLYYEQLCKAEKYDEGDKLFMEHLIRSIIHYVGHNYSFITLHKVAEARPIMSLIALKKLQPKTRDIITREFLLRTYFGNKMIFETSVPLAAFSTGEKDDIIIYCKEKLYKEKEINVAIENHNSPQCSGCMALIVKPDELRYPASGGPLKLIPARLHIFDMRTFTPEYLLSTQLHQVFKDIFTELEGPWLRPSTMTKLGLSEYIFVIRDKLQELGLLNPKYDHERSSKLVEAQRKRWNMPPLTRPVKGRETCSIM